jgi:hypothetical protein
VRSLPAAVIATGLVMTSRPGTIGVRGVARIACAAACAYALLLLQPALAQETQAPHAPPSQAPGQAPSQVPSQAPSQAPGLVPSLGLPGLFPPPPPLPNLSPPPGLIETFGRWLDEGTTKFKSDMQSAQETFDKLGNQTFDAAKDATGAVIGLPNARVVSARERCAPAQNGSPDCQAAAETLCRGKGFQGGKSLDTQSELKCPAKILLERRTPSAGECPTEIFVTRAMCQ